MWIFPHQQAEKSLQNQHVLSILQVGSHQLQYRFFRTNKPKSHYKTNTFCPLTHMPRPIGGRREACGAWPGFEPTRRAKLAARTASGRAGHAAAGDLSGNKRQQQDLLAREAVDLMHDEAAHGAHPRDSCNAEDAGAPGADLQEVLKTVSGSGGGCGHAEAPHGSAGR